IVNHLGDMSHRIRNADGSWGPWGDVRVAAGNPGNCRSVALCFMGNDLQVVAITDNGGLWHAIRFADGSWQGFGDVRGQAGNPGNFVDAGCSGNSASGELQLTGAASNGGLFHTIRHPDGSWQTFGDVRDVVGYAGSFQSASMAFLP